MISDADNLSNFLQGLNYKLLCCYVVMRSSNHKHQMLMVGSNVRLGECNLIFPPCKKHSPPVKTLMLFRSFSGVLGIFKCVFKDFCGFFYTTWAKIGTGGFSQP